MLTEQVGRLEPEPDLESRLEGMLKFDLGLMLIGQKPYFERVLS